MDDPNNTQDPVSPVNADETFVENWYEKYGEENKAHLSRYQNFDALVNSHIATKKKLGHDPDTLVQIPTEDSSDEIKAAFHKAAGKPETIEGYKFVKSPNISEKVEVVDAQVKKFAEIAHKHHLNDVQFNGVVNDYLALVDNDIGNFEGQQAEADLKANQEGNAVLNKVFLADAPNRKLRANMLLDKYGTDVFKMPDGTETTIKGMLFEENPKLLSSAWMIMLLDKIAEKMSPDTIKGLSPTTPDSADIQAKISEVRTQMDAITEKNPVNFKANAKYKELKIRKAELYKQMHAKKV